MRLALLLAATLLATPAAAATFRIVAETGDAAPGAGGATFGGFGAPALNDAGETAFPSALTGTGVTGANDTGLFTSSALVARKEDAAPGAGGATFDSFGPPRLNDAGETAFLSVLTGTGVTGANDTGIFTSSALVAREGDAAPGAGGATFGSFGNPALNDAGETAFLSFLTGTGVTSANDLGLFTSSALVAREGDAAPGAGGATFSSFNAPALNDAGETAFLGVFTGTGVTGANNTGIFTSSALVAREGDAAPGAGGATFSSFEAPALNDAGETAFLSFLTGTGVTGANDLGLFTSSGLVVRKGDAAPGAGGATFASFGNPALNDAGETAFFGVLTGTGVTGANDLGLFTSSGLVVREGDLLDFGGGDQRTLSSFGLGRNSLNESGQLAFFASFTDGSGAIVIADTVSAPIPLPASLLLLGAGLLGLGALRRHA